MQIDKKKFGSIQQVERYLFNFTNTNYSVGLSQGFNVLKKLLLFNI